MLPPGTDDPHGGMWTGRTGGGRPVNDPIDQHGRYGRGFQDSDAHQWEVFGFDPAALEGARPVESVEPLAGVRRPG